MGNHSEPNAQAPNLVRLELELVRSRIQKFIDQAKSCKDALDSNKLSTHQTSWSYSSEINAYKRVLDFIDEEIAMQET